MADRSVSPSGPAPFDAWEPPESRLEALAFAIFAVRRTLTQTLVGLPDGRLWPEGAESPGAIARGAWDREWHWLWPAEMEAPALPATPSLVEVLYGLVRHRAVTEELLMATNAVALDRPHVSRSAVAQGRSLAEALTHVALAELADADRLARMRAGFEGDWAGAEDLLARARSAVSQAVHAAGAG